jgi:acetolactate synthase-1/2/3 large subunit
VALAAAPAYLDCGPFGCLGVGVPFANAAALACPGRRVLAVLGDGAFGFTAMEIDTAVRHGLRVVYIVADNEAWNIEKSDQLKRFAGHAVGVDAPAVLDVRVTQDAESPDSAAGLATVPSHQALTKWQLAETAAQHR